MSNNFRVGQKVVCINDHWHSAWAVPHPQPKVGRVCTVLAICPDDTIEGKVGLILEEFHPRAAMWCASNFRPAVERKTDISVFTHILDEVNA